MNTNRSMILVLALLCAAIGCKKSAPDDAGSAGVAAPVPQASEYDAQIGAPPKQEAPTVAQQEFDVDAEDADVLDAPDEQVDVYEVDAVQDADSGEDGSPSCVDDVQQYWSDPAALGIASTCHGGIPCVCPPVPYKTGTPCCPDCVLKCYYPCCENYATNWHCKYGQWQMNGKSICKMPP